MSCFSCATPRRKQPKPRIERSKSLTEVVDTLESFLRGGRGSTHSFSYRDLSVATQNFHASNLLGEGGFGRVYRGRLDSGQVVAVKKLNREGMQGSSEFLVEAQMLIMLRHANLVSLIGYCAEKNNRLLVYEYMSRGSLDYHLFDLPPDKEPLDWNTRIKVAVGASRGLTYLHDEAKPAVIYRDLKSANILLDDEFNPKLSDFGLAKLGPVGGKTHVSTRVMGTYGYCAPDYAMSGKLTTKSDVYSFGVVLLELITGRKAYDSSKNSGEQNLIPWSLHFLNNRRMCCKLADPLLKGCFPILGFYRVAMIISTCLQEQPHLRPTMHDVAAALDFVASQPYVSQADNISNKSPPPSASRAASAGTTDGHQGDATS